MSAKAPVSNATEYRGKSRGAGRGFVAWRTVLYWSVTLAFLICAGGLVYLVALTHPVAGKNLLVFYLLASLGAFFGFWSLGYWARLNLVPGGEHPRDSWPCTRQAMLGASAVMIGLILMRIGHFGVPAVILLAAALIGAETVMTWLGARD